MCVCLRKDKYLFEKEKKYISIFLSKAFPTLAQGILFVRYHFNLRYQTGHRLLTSNAQSMLSVVTSVLDKCTLCNLVCFSFTKDFTGVTTTVVKLQMTLD